MTEPTSLKNAACSDTPNSEDGDIPVDVYRARVDARPLTANGEDSDSLDLEPFWEMLNADRSRAMERMRIKYLESRRHRSSSGRQIIQVGLGADSIITHATRSRSWNYA